MVTPVLLLSALVLLIWSVVLLLPWQPWRVSEVLEAAQHADADYDLSDVTVLIPARNEAETIAGTLAALMRQGVGLKVIVVNDDSSDNTEEVVRDSKFPDLRLINAKPLPPGWTGKLWAQEQGLALVNTPLTLLLDADITLRPGMIQSLKQLHLNDNRQFISLMAVLRVETFWEKLLMPSFVYFFKLLYPFSLVNSPSSSAAAAAGGCIMVETHILRDIGGMASIQGAVIDDCSLAKTVKQAGHRIWLGLSHGVHSQRAYTALADIWDMVARTAYTQLSYSILMLILCTMIMLLMFVWPVFAAVFLSGSAALINSVSLISMLLLFTPTLRFYSLNLGWSILLPLVAGLYLMMTWTSALRYWRGEKARWKGRSYQIDY